MQTQHRAHDAAEVYSPAEEAFNRKRRTVGLFLAPLAFAAVWAFPFTVPVAAHRTAAILAAVVVLWITEALPVAATALLGPTLAVVTHVAPARQVLAPFADPIVFLLIGSFMLAQAMFVHGVDRRIAYSALTLPGVGTSALRIMVVYGAVCTGLSMWISNTACTAMMFPIGLSLVSHLARVGTAHPSQVRQFGLAMMLITAFGASVGGIGTPVGTPPNLIGLGMLESIAHVHITFFQWMALGVPIMLVLFTYLVIAFSRSAVRGLSFGPESMHLVRTELLKLGPVSVAQRNVLAAFGVTVLLWIVPGVLAVLGLDQQPAGRAYATALPEGIVAMLGALSLFVIPIEWRARRFTLTWDQASNIDWAVVLLYGGGLAMGDLVFQSGLAPAMGQWITSLLPSASTVTLTVVFTAAAIALSETASNGASATMIVPISIAVAQAAGVRPIEPVLGATLGASMGFMMPISTPPNAIVYSSGYVPIGQMMRHGFMVDVLGFFVIVALVLGLGPIIF
jgi:sodium-dependent dicarboxylate transporter 2/3/5